MERVGLFITEDVENGTTALTKDRLESALHTNDPSTTTSDIIPYGNCTPEEE